MAAPRKHNQDGIVYLVEEKTKRGWETMFDSSMIDAQGELEWHVSHNKGEFRISRYIRAEETNGSD